MNIKKYLAVSVSIAAFSGAVLIAVAQETPAPSVRITAPAEGQIVEPGSDVTVMFTVDNFLFVDFKSNAEPFPGNSNAGHAHLWLDDATLNHDSAKKLLSDDLVPFGVLPKGEHTVTIDLTQNDHTPFDPPVRASVTFRVGHGGLFGWGFGSKGGGDGMQALEFVAIALLAVGALWFLVQKGAVKWLVKWASWEKKKPGAGPQPPAQN